MIGARPGVSLRSDLTRLRTQVMATPPQPRVFISAASGEFGPLRQKLADLLLAVGYQRRVPGTLSSDHVRHRP